MFYLDRAKSLKNYSLSFLKDDMLSGLTVSLISLPLAMAFAIAIDVSPKYGLFAAIVAGGIQAIFGGSETNISGPAGAFIGALTAFMVGHTYNDVLVVGMMAGAILIAASVSGIGKLVQYVPYPVILGFTGGIGVIIFKTQIAPATGIDLKAPTEIFTRWNELSYETFVIAMITMVLIEIISKFAPKLPSALLGISFSGLLVYFMKIPVTTVESKFGEIPRTLQGLSLPSFDNIAWTACLGTALAIAALAALETLLSGTASDKMTGNKHNSSAELFGCGLANLVGPLFGGIPVCGAIARTTLNAKSGSRTFIAALFNALFLLLMVLLVGPLVGKTPLAALAGVLIGVSIKLINPKLYWKLLKNFHFADFAMVTATLVLTIFVSLSVGIIVGLGIAVAAFLLRYRAAKTPANRIEKEDDGATLNLTRSLYFGNARKLTSELAEHSTGNVNVRFYGDTLLDATGLEALKDIKAAHSEQQVQILGASAKLQEAFDELGVTELFGKENIKKAA